MPLDAMTRKPGKPVGSSKGPHGRIARFQGIAPHANQAEAALRPGHPATRHATTIFRSMVFSATERPRVLIEGKNARKIGNRIEKGAWAGLPVFTLTLEERATCPRPIGGAGAPGGGCAVWSECYGNAMPFARRIRTGAALDAAIDAELHALLWRNPAGIAVRLHILGDFPDADYAWRSACRMEAHPALRVFGFTAHPAASRIGSMIAAMNEAWPDRWCIRFSVSRATVLATPYAPHQATTIWRHPTMARIPEGLVCPAQTHRTEACATCALCWAPAMATTPIAFIGHGMLSRGGRTNPRSAA